jgi:hypothetical protein
MRDVSVMTRRRLRLRRAVVRCAAAATAVALAAGCGGNGSDDSATAPTTTAPTETTTTTPPTTVLTPEQQAEAVYLEFVDTVYRLVTTGPDPDDPELARLATDPVLGRFRDTLTTMQAENHIARRGPRTSQRVMSVNLEEPDNATIRVCDVGNDTTIDQDDGSIVDAGLITRVLEVAVVQLDGEWRVSDVGTRVKLDGEVPCPE